MLKKKYFINEAEKWINHAHNKKYLSYPTANERNEIVYNYIKSNCKKKLNILEIGFGGGHLLKSIENFGHELWGIDESKEMVKIAKKKNIKNCKLLKCDIQNLKNNISIKFDMIISLGVIGYLKNDQYFIKNINESLKENGILILSTRNRLFNLFPGSLNFKNEIKNINKNYIKMDNEIKFIKKIKNNNISNKFLYELNSKILLAKKLNNNRKNVELFISQDKRDKKFVAKTRQHYPSEFIGFFESKGYKFLKIYGIHPHIFPLNLKNLIPDDIYNLFCSVLKIFNNSKESLFWSSGLVGVFKKKSKE